MVERMTLAELKAALRSGPYAWPGGYPRYFIMADGEAMAFDAVRAEFKRICREHFDASRPGAFPDKEWLVYGCQVNWEDPELYCAHTNARIESAYAEPEPDGAGASQGER